MKEFIEVRLINTGDCGVGLKDTQQRTYTIPLKGQLRISLDSFKSILDDPVSKRMICKGLVEVEGVTEEMLYGSILTEEERDYILGSRIAPVEESSGIHQIEIQEETDIIPIVKAITFYNWIKNDKVEKIKEAIQNPVNYDTLREIVEKNERYNTDSVKKLLSE